MRTCPPHVLKHSAYADCHLAKSVVLVLMVAEKSSSWAELDIASSSHDAEAPGGDSSSSETEALGIPYVRNTFLNIDPPVRSRRLAAQRSRSAEVLGTCDRYAAEAHALMFKISPVKPAQAAQAAQVISPPSTPSMSSSPLAHTSTSFNTYQDDLHEDPPRGADSSSICSDLTAEGPIGSSLAEDDGDFSEAEAREPEQVKVSDDEPMESVLARVPYDEAGEPTSIGSLAHALGECRPCAFLGSEQRPCQNGARCPFCHLPHPTKRRIRLCRRKRLEMRAAVASAVAGAGTEGINPPPRYLPISWPSQAATNALERAGFS